jgi:hypothetical protein
LAAIKMCTNKRDKFYEKEKNQVRNNNKKITRAQQERGDKKHSFKKK